MTDRLVLALDTATVVNVGLARGTEVLAVATVSDRMAHAEQLMPLVAETLADAGVRVADLHQIVVGLGPGPFTGLRVGVVTAQILATVTGVPLHGVCSLDVLAAEHAASDPAGEFVVATDARRREVYWARYAADGSRQDGPAVDRPDAVPKLPVIGPAGDIYPEQLVVAPGPRRLDPGVMAVRGPYLPDAGREPLYLRRPDASEPSRPKSVLRAR
jgi:tRNA threonylcarbamoyl adenosine modification protein YeaZ